MKKKHWRVWFFVNKINNFSKYSIIFGDRSVSQVMTSTTNAIKVVQVQDILAELMAPRKRANEKKMRSKKETHTHKCGRDDNNGHGYLMKNDEKQEARLETYELTNKLQSVKKVKNYDWFLMASTSMHNVRQHFDFAILSFSFIFFIFLVVCVILVFVFFCWHWNQELSCTLRFHLKIR